MVHEVDFEGLLKEVGVTHIVDCWGRRHPVGLVHIILTKSMFKGFGWMEQNGLSWEEYRQRWARYDHGLYVSGADKAGSQGTVCFNYQAYNLTNFTYFREYAFFFNYFFIFVKF